MQIVIDIPEEMTKAIEQGSFGAKYNMYDIIGCVMNGVPLEKVLEDIKKEISEMPSVYGKTVYNGAVMALKIINRHISGKE